jgi:hypothetical protein
MTLPELGHVHRPRWRPGLPVLWRDSTTIQLCDDVIVDRVSPQHINWLRTLDGLLTSAEIEARLTLPISEARRLLRAIHAAGALVDAATVPEPARWTGPSRRAAIADQLEAAQFVHRGPGTALRVIGQRAARGVAIVGTGAVRDAVAAAIETAGLTEVGAPRKAAVLVLADAPHPDVTAAADHGAPDVPHLHVGAYGHRATVGPLVVPGHTSCLRCAHLHRRDRDPAWPLIAVQWTQWVSAMASAPIDGLVVGLAAQLSAAMLRAWIDSPEDVEGWAERAWEITLPHPVPRTVSRPPHPLCGCLWAAPPTVTNSATRRTPDATALATPSVR